MAETLALDPYDADPVEMLDEATAAWESPTVARLRIAAAENASLRAANEWADTEICRLLEQRDAVLALLTRYGTDPDIGGFIATIDVIRDLSEAMGVTE